MRESLFFEWASLQMGTDKGGKAAIWGWKIRKRYSIN